LKYALHPICAVSLLLLTHCVPSSVRKARKVQHSVAESPVFANSLTGFILMDPKSGQVLSEHQADKYFVPASNTKILTLATCLHLLGDSLASVEYARANNTLFVRGTGDPTFLHPQFEAWQQGFRLLKTAPENVLFYVNRPFAAERFGAGWMWDDYNDQYQPERNVLPMYGNCMTLHPGGGVSPGTFQRQIKTKTTAGGPPVKRAEQANEWFVEAGYQPKEDEQYPFMTTATLDLLRDTLDKRMSLTVFAPMDVPVTARDWKVRYGCPVDTVYRQLMHHSDNHFAEQLLLMAAAKHTGGTFDQDTIIRYAKRHIFPVTSTPPNWVDGSGMSRYNLISPRFLAVLLADMHKKYPQERLFDLFPAGGVSGTVSTWYQAQPGQKPFVFAKTGSMSGVHCLSGYVVCRSGRVLVFSFMHNNFTGSNRLWKVEMQRILNEIRDTY
jgi:serine-type D-Ala-D-Ala carboxypeptidase/endopeptidase (penicillin-binding protein 4)